MDSRHLHTLLGDGYSVGADLRHTVEGSLDLGRVGAAQEKARARRACNYLAEAVVCKRGDLILGQ